MKNFKLFVAIALLFTITFVLAFFTFSNVRFNDLGGEIPHVLMIVLSIIGMVTILVGFQVFYLNSIIKKIATQGFGLCTGQTNPKYSDSLGLTDWLHEAIQDIAFADRKHRKPLTFGDLEKDVPQDRKIELRMITTNLSMRRPHMLPHLQISADSDQYNELAFSRSEWSRLFNEDVMNYLVEGTDKYKPECIDEDKGLWAIPRNEHMPVIVAVRMSLSFPVLFTAVPLWAKDHASIRVQQELSDQPIDSNPEWSRVWMSDGGISSNFPIHMFDSFLPGRPTFAMSLDELPTELQNAPPDRRIVIPDAKSKAPSLPLADIGNLVDFGWSVLNSAKDWQDQLLAGMPGQRERIARVYLSKKEGGLNIAMPREISEALMGYGAEIGTAFSGANESGKSALDFDTHRVKRALIAYEQLQDTILRTSVRWRDANYGNLLQNHADNIDPQDIKKVQERFGAFASIAKAFDPKIDPVAANFPLPPGKLRISPME